jgi:hypothetical protein
VPSVVQEQTYPSLYLQFAAHLVVQRPKMLVKSILKLESEIDFVVVRGNKRLLVVVEGGSSRCHSLDIQRASFRSFRLGRRIHLERVELDFVYDCRRETFLEEVVGRSQLEYMVCLRTWEILEIAC